MGTWGSFRWFIGQRLESHGASREALKRREGGRVGRGSTPELPHRSSRQVLGRRVEGEPQVWE